MVVITRTPRGAYLLADLDGAVSKLSYAAFRLVPYYPRARISTDISELTTGAEGAESHPAENIDNPPPRTLSDDPDVDSEYDEE